MNKMFDKEIRITEDELKKFVDGFVNGYFTGKSQLIEPERLKSYYNYSFSAISDEKLLELAEDIDDNGMENYVLVRSIGISRRTCHERRKTRSFGF